MYDYVLIGGDIRQKYLAEYLVEAGYSVFCYGVERDAGEKIGRLYEVLNESKNIILPVPLSKDGKNLYAINLYRKISFESIVSGIKAGKHIFGGNIKKEWRKCLEKSGHIVHDYFDSEKVLLMNSIATAEGTIGEMLCHNRKILFNRKVLVLGYGNCGKTIVERLLGLGAEVTVCVRNDDVFVELIKKNIDAIRFEQLCNKIKNYEYIVNTVPAKVIDKKVLAEVRKDVFIIDIASQDGGVDFKEAERLEINCRQSLGIPGKYSSASMAELYGEYIVKVSG